MPCHYRIRKQVRKRWGVTMTRRQVKACAVILTGIMLAGCKRSPEVRRDKYIAAGKQFLKKDDYARAILQFQNAAQVLPKDAETHYQLGLAYVASKQLQSAFNSFRHVLTLDPKHTGAQLQLAQ